MKKFLPLIFVLAFPVITIAQEQPAPAGLKQGGDIPGTFHVFNVNGKYGIKRDATGKKTQLGRHHSIVAAQGLNPTVLIFAREKDTGKDANLQALLLKLDAVAETDHKIGDSTFAACTVFLSPDAYDSVFESQKKKEDRTTDPKALVEQTVKRIDLIRRLETIAQPLKHVVIAYHPKDGPKGYNLAAAPALTVVVYHRLEILHLHTFAPGKMTGKHVEQIEAEVKKMMNQGNPLGVEK